MPREARKCPIVPFNAARLDNISPQAYDTARAASVFKINKYNSSIFGSKAERKFNPDCYHK